eukprot:Phypoly_transcript_22008.p1 GENE.Phypoly_transcript_22008~~Phypoly_transcript_22008.p1  ORF type:complete len:124 (+),score=18.99 Phypoly_transcript_22008:58-429(+)
MSQATSTETSQEPISMPPLHIPSKPRCSYPACPNFARRGDTICSQCARKPTEEMKMLRDAQKTLQYAHEREERSFIARQAAFAQIQQQDFNVCDLQAKNVIMDSNLSKYLSQAMTYSPLLIFH